MSDRINGLYALCDNTFSPQVSHVKLARLFLEGGAALLQLRLKGEKDLSRIEEITRAILREKKHHSFTFILNDYVELAEKLPVDGIHVGQDDLPIRELRKRVGREKIIGYSSHSLPEALQAEKEGADYVAFGAIYPTQTKGPGHPVQGIEKLKEVVQTVKIPVVAIGGIHSKNLREVLETKVAAVAMITALTQASDIVAATRYFVEKIREKQDSKV